MSEDILHRWGEFLLGVASTLAFGRETGNEMTPLEMFVYCLGVVVACSGGIAIAATSVWWMIDRCLRFYSNSIAIYRVAVHAREHGLDLRTGKPIHPSEPS